MNLTHYRALRAKGMMRSKALVLSGVTPSQIIKSALHYIGVALIALAIVLMLSDAAMARLQVGEAGAESRALRSEIQRLESVVIACLNRHPFTAGDEVFLCNAAPSGYKK